MVRGSV
jgi:hypothetical protein